MCSRTCLRWILHCPRRNRAVVARRHSAYAPVRPKHVGITTRSPLQPVRVLAPVMTMRQSLPGSSRIVASAAFHNMVFFGSDVTFPYRYVPRQDGHSVRFSERQAYFFISLGLMHSTTLSPSPSPSQTACRIANLTSCTPLVCFVPVRTPHHIAAYPIWVT